jgi:hypothetical protein
MSKAKDKQSYTLPQLMDKAVYQMAKWTEEEKRQFRDSLNQSLLWRLHEPKLRKDVIN